MHSDGTRVIALRCGADYALRLTLHRGWHMPSWRGSMPRYNSAPTRSSALTATTDERRIPDLLMPILGRRAAMVVGSRPVSDIANFFRIKAGSNVVSVASGVRVPDATSGFRAIHWTAAIVLRSHNRFSYVLEHLIQAGRNGIPVVSVPIRVKGDPRPSRLIRSTPDYLWRSATTIIRVFAINRPFTVLRRHEPGSHPAGDRPRASVSRALRAGPGAGTSSLLILAAVLIIAGIVAAAVALLTDVIAATGASWSRSNRTRGSARWPTRRAPSCR